MRLALLVLASLALASVAAHAAVPVATAKVPCAYGPEDDCLVHDYDCVRGVCWPSVDLCRHLRMTCDL